jgi:N-acetyl-1-D-myo-inositol-2-amino-2-deoxy-alpha-D-glucopyranoside deacetylase
VSWRAFEQASGLTKFYATAAPDSDLVTTEIDATGYLDAKIAAMRAHATQIAVSPPFFALTNNVPHPLSGVECYTLLAGPRGPGHRDTEL